MGFRLIILGVLGVGALYVMHLLAQDYQKIRKPIAVAAKLLLGKRDLIDQQIQLNLTKAQTDEFNNINWDKILRRDPFNCALSLICQIVAGAEKNNEEANAIYEIVLISIESKKDIPKNLIKSFQMGQKLYSENVSSSYKKCYTNYPFCPYSARTMLKLMQIDSYLFGGSKKLKLTDYLVA